VCVCVCVFVCVCVCVCVIIIKKTLKLYYNSRKPSSSVNVL
jgi:hypothetical protein